MKRVSLEKLARVLGRFSHEVEVRGQDDDGVLSMLFDRLDAELGEGFRRKVYDYNEKESV